MTRAARIRHRWSLLTTTEQRIIAGIASFAMLASIFVYLVAGIPSLLVMWVFALIYSVIFR